MADTARAQRRSDKAWLIATVIAFAIALPILARLAWRIASGE